MRDIVLACEPHERRLDEKAEFTRFVAPDTRPRKHGFIRRMALPTAADVLWPWPHKASSNLARVTLRDALEAALRVLEDENDA